MPFLYPSLTYVGLAQDLTHVPWAHLFSFAKRALHWFTLLVAASSHSAQSRLLVGRGVSPNQASNSSILLFSSLSKVASKKREGLFGGGWCPQIVIMSGEWSNNFLMEAAASIRPPLSSISWETKNLSILETAEWALDLPLSNVKFFFDIFLKLSSLQASTRPYCNVIWCQVAASRLWICLSPDIPCRLVSSRWLKSPPTTTWSAMKSA